MDPFKAIFFDAHGDEENHPQDYGGETRDRHTRREPRFFSGGSDHLRRRSFAGGKGRGKRIATGERGGDLQRRGRTFFRVGLQATKDHPLDQGIEIAHQRRGIGDGALFAQLHQFRDCGGLEGALARQDFVEDKAE